VQSALPGNVASDDTRLAPVAGALLCELHERDARELRPTPPERQLRAAAESARLVAALLPELEPRATDLVERLEDALPRGGELVCSHGDFEVGQLLEHGSEVALLDFDELCAAPRALDVANYAAHAARKGGAAAALAVTEALVSSYGSRPDALAPYLAGAILVRAQAPFRKLEDNWPARVDALVAAAEEVLA
jgi:aminoglycoside phosphotransferase (APT) family kinase protein